MDSFIYGFNLGNYYNQMLRFITKIYKSSQISTNCGFKIAFPLYSFAIAKKKTYHQEKKGQYTKKNQSNKKTSNMSTKIHQKQKTQDFKTKQQKQEKLDEFNAQVMQFLESNVNQQTMINWAVLSSIYNIIKLAQAKYKKQNDSTSRLNPKVSIQIKRIFQKKSSQAISQHNWKFHEMVIDSINLLLLVQYSNFSKKILNHFIQYLQRVPIKDISTKPQNTLIIKFQDNKNAQSTTDLNNSNLKLLHVPISKFPLSILTELSFRMIKLCSNRSKQELFDSIKVFSRLLNISELKQLDQIVYQRLVLSYQSIINEIQQQKCSSNIQQITFKDIGKIVSIFSQLKLKMKTMELCQQIFSIFIQSQFTICSLNIEKLQAIKVEPIINISDVELYPLDFSNLIKNWIGMTDLGMFELQQNIQRLMLTAFKMNQLAVKLILLQLSSRNSKQKKQQKLQLVSLLSKIKLSQKEFVVSISLLHRFKKGNYFFENQANYQTQSNKANRVQNIWTYLVKSIIGSRIMQQYINHQLYFFILSGVCRSLPQYYLLQNGKQLNQKLHHDLFYLLSDIYKNGKLINLQKKRSIQQFLEESLIVYTILNCIIQETITNQNMDSKNIEITFSIVKDYTEFLQKVQIDSQTKVTKIQKGKSKQVKNLFLFLFKCLNLDLYYYKRYNQQINQQIKHKQNQQNSLKQEIKMCLKKSNLIQNQQILVNILIKNYSSLKTEQNNNLKEKQQDNHALNKIKQYKSQLNFFLGLSKSIDQVQYLKHLTQNYLKKDELNYQNQQNQKEKEKNNDLIEICQSFKTQVVIEQILRTKLIGNQDDFNQFAQT